MLAFPKQSYIRLLIFALHNNLVRDIHKFILWMKKQRLMEVKRFAYGHELVVVILRN